MGRPATPPQVSAIVERSKCILTVMLLNIGVVQAAEDPAEDFSNAFISDLAPLISLFGDQVTKQFMSQSMYWYDHIIFAMAPLGIITAVVSAIRVGGPNFLRAIVGRARESRGAVEVELMSSTSHDVCELWNGSQIVRVMGSSPIKQILFFPDKREDVDTGGFHTLETAVQCKLLEKEQEKSYIDRLLNRSSQPASDPENPKPSRPNTDQLKPFAPNIALNFGRGVSRWELRLIAAIGVILQFGVLLAESLITHYPTLKLRKESPISSGASQFTISGTLVLVFGMLLCSYVVEQSTRETTWKSVDEGCKFYIVWIQKGGTVNDQNFESFALFGKDERTSIMTSHPIHAALNGERQPNRPTSAILDDYRKDRYITEDDQLSKFTETLVMTATGMSIGGFFLQFIGLRGMHWSAMVAQIGAILLMTGLRAFIRRDIVEAPFAQRLPKDFEIDWLATRLAGAADEESHMRDRKMGFPKSFWERLEIARKTRPRDRGHPEDRTSSEESEDDGSDAIFWGKSCINWDINSQDFIDVTSKRLQEQPSLSTGTDDIIKIRKRLQELTGWDGPATITASCLSKATESIIHTFDSSGTTFQGSLRGLCWPLDVVINNKPQVISLTIRFEKGKWTADSRELEAVISLWLYALCQKHPGEKKVQVLGRKTVPLIRDYSWWVKDNSNPIQAMVVSENAKTMGNDHEIVGRTEMELKDCDFFGYGLGDGKSTEIRTGTIGGVLKCQKAIQHMALTKQKLQLDSKTLQEYNSSASSLGPVNLALATYSSTEEMCAKHLFSIFMLAVANTIEKDAIKKVGGHTTLQENGILGDIYDIKLENTVLEELAQGVQQAGLCSRQEATLTIITALSLRGKLPKVDALVKWAQEKAAPHELTGRYAEAGNIYLWLYRSCITFGWGDKIVMEVVALLHEFSGTVTNMVSLWQKQHRSGASYQEMAELKVILHGELAKGTKTGYGIPENDLRLLKTLSSMMGRLRQWHSPSSTDFALAARHGLERFEPFHFTGWHWVGLTQTRKRLKMVLDVMKYDLSDVDVIGRTPLHYAVSNPELYSTNNAAGDPFERAADPNIRDISGFTPLHHAARCNNQNAVLSLLQEGGDTEARGRDGTTALHCAALIGNLEVTRLLLNAGASLEVQDNSKRTPLHWAASSGNGAVVRALVARGASTSIRDNYGRIPLHNALFADWQDNEYSDGLRDLLRTDKETEMLVKDRDGCTALHLAATAGNNVGILVLLDQKADIEIKANDGRTAIQYAASNGKKETMELLLKKGANLDARDDCNLLALHWASREGRKDIVLLYLGRKDVDVNLGDSSGKTPLSWAAVKGEEAVVRLLLDHQDVDVNWKDISGMTPLSWAAEKGHQAVVRLLLDHKNIDVNSKNKSGRTPLALAAADGQQAVVRLLLQHNDLDVNPKDDGGRTPLSWAAEKGHVAVVQLLLEHTDIDVNSKCSSGRTPMTGAAAGGREAVVRLLIQHKDLDVNLKDDRGWTPLSWAVAQGHEAVVRLFHDHKDVNSNSMNDDRQTSLSFAAGKGHKGVMRLLLDHKDIDVNSEDLNCRTPLSLAAENGHEIMVRLLLEHRDVDVNSRNINGRTPLYFAAYSGYLGIVKLLLSRSGYLEGCGSYYGTPLQAATLGGHPSTVEVLLQAGADPLCQDSHGWTPLLCASFGGNQGIRNLFRCYKNVIRASTTTKRPKKWSFIHKNRFAKLENDGIDVVADANDMSEFMHAVVQADHPFSRRIYFEVTIIHGASDNVIGIGLASGSAPLDEMPGWGGHQWWGYHGDKGGFYDSDSPRFECDTYGKGDVVGCGLDQQGGLFFTKNGKKLGTPFQHISGQVFAVVGMKKGGHIRGNFGPDFLFQLEDQEVAQSNAGPNEENIAGVLG